jgi:hypothetical protein
LLTTLVFAAHAILGCGVHHLCAVPVELPSHGCSQHGGLMSHHSESPVPTDGEDRSGHSCNHTACAFVKADTPRIEHGERSLLPVCVPIPIARVPAAVLYWQSPEKIGAGILSAQLYVWHCALLI